MGNLSTLPQKKIKDKRLFLVGALMLIVGIIFWAGSRYPALNEKAIMGADTELSALGFDTLVKVTSNLPLIVKIIYNTINWIYTNKQGMTFGLLFSALLMTLFSLLSQRQYRNTFANLLLGMFIGTPLGVCVNCAAPIAKGLYSAGASVETTLAMMVSSPTLNLVVLTMLFSMFPHYIATIKIGLTIVFIFVCIPFLTRLLPTPKAVLLTEKQRQKLERRPYLNLLTQSQCQREEPVESWSKAFCWLVLNSSKNLWIILKTTVPLMVLAGLLGAAFVTIIPFESLARIMPVWGYGITLVSMLTIAIIGIFMPVPMAFDVILTAVLWQAGLPIKYAATLLFTLGIFSIYSYFIVSQAISRKVALGATTLLVILGIFAGGVSHKIHKWDVAKQKHFFYEALSQTTTPPRVIRVESEQPIIPAAELAESLKETALISQPMLTTDQLSIQKIPFQPKNNQRESKNLFTKKMGGELGLDEPYYFSVEKLIEPFAEFRGIAAGDIHNDGLVDLALTSEQGVSLYANQSGHGYVRQQINIPQLKEFYTVNVALVDLNNDAWLDIVFSAYNEGNYVIYNQSGDFLEENLHLLPNHPEAIMSGAFSFGDWDRDKDLDLVLGNWAFGTLNRGNRGSSMSRNVLLINEDNQYQVSPLSGEDGETLTALLTDFNNDNLLDLIIGNDFEPPDLYYIGNGSGDFQLLTSEDNIIPYSTKTTMSVAAADLNNDLTPEIYLGQISHFDEDSSDEQNIQNSQLCSEIDDLQHQKTCKIAHGVRDEIVANTLNNVSNDVRQCQSIESKEYISDCIAWSLVYFSVHQADDNPELCNLFPNSWERFSFICKHSPNSPIPTEYEIQQDISQVTEDNVLLMKNAKGKFVDQATDMGINKTGWTWNAKFADLDNDQWQDLYAVNGWFLSVQKRNRTANIFYHNQQGKKFVDATESLGLDSLLSTSAYTYLDIENDGDLDIVSVPIAGPILVYVNNSINHHSIDFELRDQAGNSFGIGSKIIIHYGDGDHQMREIQAGGGFISFDPAIAHFGLGHFEKVEQVDIVWSTGEQSEIRGDFAAGAKYIITRKN